jgi:RNA polymerase sigma-70 factor (ECF subfamily)
METGVLDAAGFPTAAGDDIDRPSSAALSFTDTPARRCANEVDYLLFERVAMARSEAAFSELYDRFSRRVYALLRQMMRSDEDAQDLLQEVFLLIWNKAPEFFESRGNPASWILTVARNRAVDEMRSKRYRNKRSEETLVMGEERPEIQSLIETRNTPEAQLASKEAQFEIRRALKTLTIDQRELVDLAYFGGLSYSEIAERKGIPLSTVKTRMKQSFVKLARVVKPRM